MNAVYEKVLGCYESIKDQIPFTPKVALVLGSGLGNYADTMDVKADISVLKTLLAQEGLQNKDFDI